MSDSTVRPRVLYGTVNKRAFPVLGVGSAAGAGQLPAIVANDLIQQPRMAIPVNSNPANTYQSLQRDFSLLDLSAAKSYNQLLLYVRHIQMDRHIFRADFISPSFADAGCGDVIRRTALFDKYM